MLIGPSPGRYLLVNPASTSTVDPVMWRPVSDTRCKIVFVTSSGSINPALRHQAGTAGSDP
jgi:hypothetical protein